MSQKMSFWPLTLETLWPSHQIKQVLGEDFNDLALDGFNSTEKILEFKIWNSTHYASGSIISNISSNLHSIKVNQQQFLVIGW